MGKLKIHEGRHTGLRPHKCNHCERAFVTKYDCAKHEEMHAKERPYRCKLCGKGYVQLSTEENPYSCNVCGVVFTKWVNFRRPKELHRAEKQKDCTSLELKSKHMKEKPFICKDCGTVMTFECTTLTNVFTVSDLSHAKCFMKKHTVVSQ